MFNTFVLHDDYEAFAKYIGVDYEDFVNLQYGFDADEYEDVVVEYEIPALV